MPREFTIKGGYGMWIYFKDHGAPHVHIKGHGKEAKIEISSLAIVRNRGFADHELNALQGFILKHQDYLLRRYDEVQKK